MLVSAEVLSSLLDVIYKTALCPHHWPKFMETFKAACVADRTFFVSIDSIHARRKPLSEVRQRQKPVSERAGSPSGVPPGGLTCVTDADTFKGARQSIMASEKGRNQRLFDELTGPRESACQCDASLTFGDASLDGYVPTAHPAGCGEGGVADIKEMMPILVPHVQRAMWLHYTVSGLRQRNDDMLSSLETFGLALIGVDPTGRVVWLTEAARALLASGNGIRIANNKLFVSMTTERARFDELIHRASGAGSGYGVSQAVRRTGNAAPPDTLSHAEAVPVGGAMLIGRRASKRALQVVVTPFPSSGIHGRNHAAALVFLSDPDARPDSRQKLLQALYAFSPMECRVCDLLISGHEVLCIAEKLDISIDTVRFHLKSIFRKTGTNRQSELVRLILGLPGKRLVLAGVERDAAAYRQKAPRWGLL